MSVAMEILIIICLLIVIVLLVKDKIVIKKVIKTSGLKSPEKSDFKDIMGKPKPFVRHLAPIKADERQSEKTDETLDSFENDISERRFVKESPQEELDEVFADGPDLEEEEVEERNRHSFPIDEEGFATGVTFDELSTVGVLLKQEELELSQELKAMEIVQRIQGTELFSLLESSIEGASGRIAALLDRSLATKMDSGSSGMRKNGLNEFDIGEFV